MNAAVPDPRPDPAASGWADYAAPLATFVLANLFVRTDAYGEFHAGKRGETIKEPISLEILEAHVRGERFIGVHTTSPANESLFGALDFDESDNPLNREIALWAMQMLRDAGFTPLLEESRENRYHLLIRFSGPVPTARVYAFLADVAARCMERGLTKPVETFPKQAEIGEGKYGNWLRLPGNHPVDDFSSRIFDPETDTWLEGADAAQAFLQWAASNPHALPEIQGAPAPTAIEPPQTRQTMVQPSNVVLEGGRNSRLASLGGSMRTKGMSTDAIMAALLITNSECCHPPLPESEVRKIAASMGRYPPGSIPAPLETSESEIAPIEYLDLERYAKEGIPAVDWLAVGWITSRDIGLTAGPGGIGKSTTLAGWAYALTGGEPFCGIETVRPLRVLYIDEEMGASDTVRLFLRIGPPRANLRVASCQGFRLDTDEGIERLGNAIADWKAEVVFGDSVQQLFGSVDENSASEVGRVYHSLFRLRDELGVSIELSHHKRKSGVNRQEKIELVRGSTAHSTQASCVVYASPGEGSRLQLEQVKRRGATKQSVVIRYEETEKDGPIRLTGEGAVDGSDAQLEKAKDWTVEYVADRGQVTTKELHAAADDAKVPWRSVERGLPDLVESGELEKPKRGHYRVSAKGSKNEVF